MTGGPTPDDSLKIDFAVSNGTLQVDDGIPPISKMNVTGHVTGRKVVVRAPTGLPIVPGWTPRCCSAPWP